MNVQTWWLFVLGGLVCCLTPAVVRMYVPPHFSKPPNCSGEAPSVESSSISAALDAIDRIGFAFVTAAVPCASNPSSPRNRLVAMQVPVCLRRGRATANGHPSSLDEQGLELLGHYAAGNEAATTMHNQPVMALFLGPHGYISPAWYPDKQRGSKVVPTWNYVAVHVHGVLQRLESDAQLTDVLDRLTEQNETARIAASTTGAAQTAPRWRMSDAPEAYLSALRKQIVGFRIRVHRVEAAWKLSQNKPPQLQVAVSRGLSDLTSTRHTAASPQLLAAEMDGRTGDKRSTSLSAHL